MTSLLDILLPLLVSFGYPIIMAVVMLGEFGVPLPVSPLLLAAGSLTVDNTFNLLTLIIVVAATAISGDLIGYHFGKKIGLVVKNKKIIFVTGKYLKRWGGWGIFFSRWLMTPLCVPMNIVAGIAKYSLNKFVFSVIAGEIIWATLYIYLGYIFGINWQLLLDYLNNTPLIITLLVVGIGMFYLFDRR